MKDAFEAKKRMLQALKEMMASEDDMGLKDHLKGHQMAKVEVAAENPDDLAEGLDKAKDILQKRGEMMGFGGEEDPEEVEAPGDEIDDNEESEDPKKKHLEEMLAKRAKK